MLDHSPALATENERTPAFTQTHGSPSAAAAELGKRGGAARAQKLSLERRQEIARKAALARWSPLDLAMFRDIAAQLDAEALAWKQGFAIWQGKRRGFVWPEKSDPPWVPARVEKLEQSANYLRSLANNEPSQRGGKSTDETK